MTLIRLESLIGLTTPETLSETLSMVHTVHRPQTTPYLDPKNENLVSGRLLTLPITLSTDPLRTISRRIYLGVIMRNYAWIGR